VPFSAVDLKHQAVADKKVYAADPIDQHLASHPEPTTTHGQAGQRFDSRLRFAVDLREKEPAARRCEQDPLEFGPSDQRAIERRVDRHDGGSQIKALDSDSHRVCRRVDRALEIEARVRPVEAMPTARRDGDTARDQHVKVSVGHCPRAMKGQGGHACQMTSDPHRLCHLIGNPWSGVHPAAEADQAAIPNATRDGASP